MFSFLFYHSWLDQVSHLVLSYSDAAVSRSTRAQCSPRKNCSLKNVHISVGPIILRGRTDHFFLTHPLFHILTTFFFLRTSQFRYRQPCFLYYHNYIFYLIHVYIQNILFPILRRHAFSKWWKNGCHGRCSVRETGRASSEGNICCLINVAWVVLVCGQEVSVNVFASSPFPCSPLWHVISVHGQCVSFLLGLIFGHMIRLDDKMECNCLLGYLCTAPLLTPLWRVQLI